MNTDPDFHDTAAAWLDGTADEGQRRVLREILRDSPDAATDFAAVARTEAALQLTGFSHSERLQRARRLLEPSVPSMLRRFIARPVVRWSAAAALLATGVLWYALSGGEPATDRGTPRFASHPQRIESSFITRTTTPPELLPAADKNFARRMSRFIVREFKASGVPLASALDTLRKDIAAIDDTAVPDFSAAPELPDDRIVHLHLRYLPVAVLVDVIAIQTGTRFQSSGKGYRIAVDAKAPMPGEMQEYSYEADRLSRLPFGIGHSGAGPEPVNLYAEQGFENCLGEKADKAVIPDATDSFFLRVHASARLHKILSRLIPVGSRAWMWTIKVVEIDDAKEQTKFSELTGGTPRMFSSTEIQKIMLSISQLKGLDLATLPEMIIPDGESKSSFVGRPSSDPQNAPDDWTGIRGTVNNLTAGDSEGMFEWLIEISEPVPGAAPARAMSRGSGRLSHGQTLLVQSGKTADGRLRAFFVTGNDPNAEDSPQQEGPPDIGGLPSMPTPASPPAAQENLPYGIPVVGKKGMVLSPYAEDKGMVDVSDLPRGTRVHCPYTGKDFRVP